MSWKKPESGKDQSFPLDNSIKELENMITDRSHIDRDAIPVLDDIVDPETYTDPDSVTSFTEGTEEMEISENDFSENCLSQEQIEMLVGKMDQRISGELEELVNILKDALKDSIITEIKTQLETGTRGEENNLDSENDERPLDK